MQGNLYTVVSSFHLVFFRRLGFDDTRKKASLKLPVQTLIKEGTAQSVAVLGVPSFIICQDPSVLVWSPELGDI